MTIHCTYIFDLNATSGTAFKTIWSCSLAYGNNLRPQPIDIRYMVRSSVTASGRLLPAIVDPVSGLSPKLAGTAE